MEAYLQIMGKAISGNVGDIFIHKVPCYVLNQLKVVLHLDILPTILLHPTAFHLSPPFEMSGCMPDLH